MSAYEIPSPAGSSFARLRRISVAASLFCYLAAALMLVGVVWVWTSPASVLAYMQSTVGAGAAPAVPSARGYWLGLALSLVPAGLFTLAMLRLGRLFGRFRRGIVLDEGNAVELSRIGWLLFAFGAVTPIIRALQSVALTFDNPTGQKQLAITLDPGVFGALAAGAVLVAFGLVLREAVWLADENQSFV
ncbi:DUF2975 domain-containing protein [Bosea sp. BK604]|uniref:DUF2975 domain-containing protein n=1 Tax=Bosea sp. BK604 TaxID=2512180 RepID=UPI00104456FE|nr:DUF2975 domain-containing protein [Bosea sp. BK604]TCR63392.1 DUF2975 family protein [Bosea sp. BK604]